METQGKRLPDGQIPTKPGEYAKIMRQNGETDWLGVPPKEGMIAGTFLKNSVTEHEDGTITVDTLLTYNKNYPDFPQWRGRLKNGMWTDSFIIKCRECGCTREICNKEIPEGECEYCRKEFGFYFYPGQKINEDKTVNNDHVIVSQLEPGDIVTIDTKLPPKDEKRVFSIERAGKIIYAKDS